ncbi:hypothetical protein [Flavobacterium sp.]|uniref:hypothetical protein n=1 Tax=Flavobacterium sp. TaxID=239 RepID=UPI0025BDBFFF|nr:hypothetical protein [Flavobacterium sp.]MBA4154281.1 hypothetical protein [Flavobacterium sp.]
MPEPILRKSAKKTTYLTITAINEAVFLVIDKKFLQFIKQFKVSEFQTWDLNVQYSDEILKDYCLFHLSSPSQERIIDFSKSDFEIIKYKTKETEKRKYLSYKDYKDDWNREIYKGNTLIFNKLFLNFSSINFDIVRLILMPVKGNGYFVSERFKQAIEEQGFTGMAFKEIEQIDSRIKVIY